MNKQGVKGIEWTQYTWNPIGGCFHDCRWEMPDGSIAKCYAETTANGIAQAAYPNGFAHHYWHPERLDEPLKLKTPARIFLDSMSDAMGYWVSDGEIVDVLMTCDAARWHTFQLLTKNAPRLLRFVFPANVWVGASVPPSFYRGRQLTHDQQVRMLNRTLDVLRQVKTPVRWMSIEPLSFDIAPYMQDCGLQWVVIGAASNGARKYQPERAWVQNLLDTLDGQNIPVFFKGNLEWQPWREAYPEIARGDTKTPLGAILDENRSPHTEPYQLALF